LWTFLGNRKANKNLRQLLHSALMYHELHHALGDVPDRGNEIDLGSRWLRTPPDATDILVELVEEIDPRRAAQFVIRTFLYLGYHEVTGLVFVPDAVRASLVGNVVASEQEVREKLLGALKPPPGKGAERTEPPVSRISPLAAVVFERSSQRNEILHEMEGLREELAPLRERVRGAEKKIFYGKGVEVSDGIQEWKLVAAELQKSFGSEPHLVSLRSILRLGREFADVADEPVKAKNWLAFLLGLPFEVASRLLSRRPAVELHHLRDEVPGVGRLQRSVQRLFGSEIGTG
jgi:hypothetical protein